MAKKETLKLNEYDDKEKLIFLTISSSESDIRLCMLINQVFHINMSLSEDLSFKSGSGSLHFKKYYFEEEIEEEKYTLLINQHPGGKYLFPEFKNIDYILVISPGMQRKNFDLKIKKLKENPGIAAVFKIDPNSVKSLRRLEI